MICHGAIPGCHVRITHTTVATTRPLTCSLACVCVGVSRWYLPTITHTHTHTHTHTPHPLNTHTHTHTHTWLVLPTLADPGGKRATLISVAMHAESHAAT